MPNPPNYPQNYRQPSCPAATYDCGNFCCSFGSKCGPGNCIKEEQKQRTSTGGIVAAVIVPLAIGLFLLWYSWYKRSQAAKAAEASAQPVGASGAPGGVVANPLAVAPAAAPAYGGPKEQV